MGGGSVIHFAHLVARFVRAVAARPLSPREQAEVEALLRPEERRLFWDQPAIDQRHALEGARRIFESLPGEGEVARAALLHDVGKRHSGLGILGRSMASGVRLLGLRPRRWHRYYDHGSLGAAELEAAGAEGVVVDWARHHTSRRRPGSLTATHWAALKRSDRA
jgi:hypothetical protein